MKLHSLKRPKKTKAQIKKENAICEPDREEYPWGMRLDFNTDEMAMVPETAKLKVGDEVDIKAIGKVIARSVNTRSGETKARRHVEIQLMSMGVAKKSNAEKDFDEELDA